MRRGRTTSTAADTDGDAASRPPVHPVDEVLPPGRTLTLGLQHILSMYAGVVAPPLVVGAAAGLRGPDLAYLVSAALVMAGVATLVQTLGVWRFGIRMPFVNGPTFAAVTPMVLVVHGGGGLPAVFGAALVSSLVGLAIAGRFSRLVRFFPPLVTGTVITLIGLSILKVGVQWSAGGAGAPDFGSPRNLAVAFGVLLFIVLVQRFARGFVGRISVLLGLLVGTVVAVPLGMADLSEVTRVDLVGITTPFHFGAPRFELAAIVSMLIVQLVILAECTADALAIGEVVGRPVGPRELARALRADTAASALSSVLNAFPCSAFAQNIGLVQLTGVRSRFVVAVGGGVLVLLGLLPPLGALVAAIPSPVLGGAGIALFGTVAASGVRTLGRSGFRGPHDLLVVGVALGVGMIPLAAPTFWEQLPDAARTVLDSGISVGTVAAIALNLLFNGRPSADPHQDARAAIDAGDVPPLPAPRTPNADQPPPRRSVRQGARRTLLWRGRTEREEG
ncbi:xanthine permease [Streptoalloteichus tenebrarius]|uniref:Xanthine permease n=1 Tax=Streptoalloteichus tenebrarius (strain ATCC 17920 / DSM 40477 / JCM 4838 / CBS 697.72 / NBRC 16177 / NCIMB 11028 / NRRL B-12390 / A12253. 1 / ISP 5477) TaxID=1933 RepID=A0ABT1HQG5_STRSD|nr:nucleobase:cation symporter-2 family protein [Streptoalloteichus tenebrarius]MCP2257737.1 xanthine permease [Streptoalloteichus tenebrarius]BFE99909.1 nucleobase:cation symporter-2 family protein [Streptoalloteichus tenebrarius]